MELGALGGARKAQSVEVKLLSAQAERRNAGGGGRLRTRDAQMEGMGQVMEAEGKKDV